MILRCALAAAVLSLSLTVGCQGITSSSAENHAGAAGVGFETGGSGAEAGASGTVSGRGGDGAQAGTSGADQGRGGSTTGGMGTTGGGSEAMAGSSGYGGSATCEYNGAIVSEGDSVPAVDGCNSCTCNSGLMVCTLMACPVTCSYAGRSYADGESFASQDGCNTCSCANGLVACTERACVCNPAVEHWRDYVTTVPSECEVIDYACLAGSTQFENACGCGCEQSPDCPEYYNCMPTVSDPVDTGASSGVDLPSVAACPTPEQTAACPLTQIAY